MSTSTHNNPTGINGYGIKMYPDDDTLRASLHQYAKEKLGTAERLARLEAEHGLVIRSSRLYELNRKFDVPSVRKPPSHDIATQAVLEKVAEDVSQKRGVGTIGTLLSNEGMPLPRDFIRKVLALHAPEGLNRRFPGANSIKRSTLSSIGPNHQHHADGHDKLNAQGLNMGGVELKIYGIKDQWSSFILHFVVVPNNRLATTIGHVHLDCLEKHQFIPITFVVDKGSETGYILTNQKALRETYAPEIEGDRFPPTLGVRSVHNTPIEGCWHWFSDTFGITIKDVIRDGYLKGIYNPNNPVHPSLFYWLWPKILQCQLNKFVEYWNNHKIRKQKEKSNMSGFTPRHAFTVPQAPAQDCRIQIDQPAIDALRAQIPVLREDAMRWVSVEFDHIATNVYQTIGSPLLDDILSGWDIFSSMAPLISVT